MSLKIENLFKKYDGKWVLRDVSLEIKTGEIFGLFGLTGVGKSTFIRTIAGIEPADSGRILIDNEDLTKKTRHERGFHFPKITNESFWQTVFQSKKRSELADGEGQQLALEAALHEAKDILLLDNSFCQMDHHLRLENYEKLRDQAKEKNLTVIFTTNDHEEIFQVCDRVAVLHECVIQQIGTPREIYQQPVNAIVAGVFGKNNLFAARRVSSSNAAMPEFQTLVGEHRLHTAAVEKKLLGAINQNVTLAIRPEHISISSGASFPEDNLIKATVTDVDYLGATTIIELEAEGLRLQTMVLRLVGLNVGDECVVGLPPDRIMVLKD